MKNIIKGYKIWKNMFIKEYHEQKIPKKFLTELSVKTDKRNLNFYTCLLNPNLKSFVMKNVPKSIFMKNKTIYLENNFF